MYYVYILTNTTNQVLYTGFTNHLARRIWEHRNGVNEGFTKKYKVHKLVYYEAFGHANDAITREKQIKKYLRSHKIKMIEDTNPSWRDLSEDFK